MNTAERLSAGRVTVKYGGVRAIDGVSDEFGRGEIVGLIGPNGAGKTTFANVLSGFQSPQDGFVRLGEVELGSLKPHEVRRAGIARTFQSCRLFASLSVRENVEASVLHSKTSRKEISEETDAVLYWLGMLGKAEKIAGNLPYTDERRVAIARAIIGAPKFVILDEPAAGMSDEECDELSEIVKELPARFSCGVVLIDHNMRLIGSTCERVHVLDSGKTIARGSFHEVMGNPSVKKAYLGYE